MSKRKDFDFGFSLVSEEELKSLERDLAKQNEEVNKIASTYKDKYENLHELVMQLLKEMSKDPNKAYIFWPNRIDRINAFIRYIDELNNEQVTGDK